MAMYGMEGADPLRPPPLSSYAGAHEDRHRDNSWVVATGTLACPRCDAPVVLGGAVGLMHDIACPFCHHCARAREFLTLEDPARPNRVIVRVSVASRPQLR